MPQQLPWGCFPAVALLFSPVLVLVCIAWDLLIWRSLNFKTLLLLAGLPPLIVSLITAASIPGLVLMHRANRFATYLLAACIVSCPLIYYLVRVEQRYRYPILWVGHMATAYLLTRQVKLVISLFVMLGGFREAG